MKDAVEFYSKTSVEKSSVINDLLLGKNQFVLATIHRQENTDDKQKLENIFSSLDKIHQEKQVVLPLHPRTKKKLEDFGIETNITLIDPIGYFDMLELLKNCTLVITDSGGLQKEAFFNKKHCIIAREETEWIELVDNGFAKIVGSNPKKTIESFTQFESSNISFDKNLYGENVGESIYQSIKNLIS